MEVNGDDLAEYGSPGLADSKACDSAPHLVPGRGTLWRRLLESKPPKSGSMPAVITYCWSMGYENRPAAAVLDSPDAGLRAADRSISTEADWVRRDSQYRRVAHPPHTADRPSATTVAESMRTFGQTGEMDGLALFRDNLNARGELAAVHAVRAPATSAEVGERAGSAPVDDVERQVCQTVVGRFKIQRR